MSHLSDERLFELGTGLGARLRTEEARHVAACPVCAQSLDAERRLMAALVELPQPETPPEFVDATTTRFRKALATRDRRSLVAGIVAALLVGSLLALAMAALLVANAGEVAASLATTVESVVVIGRAVLILLEKVPLVSVPLICAICTVLLLSASATRRLAHGNPA